MHAPQNLQLKQIKQTRPLGNPWMKITTIETKVLLQEFEGKECTNKDNSL